MLPFSNKTVSILAEVCGCTGALSHFIWTSSGNKWPNAKTVYCPMLDLAWHFYRGLVLHGIIGIWPHRATLSCSVQSRDERIFFLGRIRIRILFVNQKIFESESKYYSRFKKRFEYIRISKKVRIFKYYSNSSVIFEENVENKKQEFRKHIQKAHVGIKLQSHPSTGLVHWCPQMGSAGQQGT